MKNDRKLTFDFFPLGTRTAKLEGREVTEKEDRLELDEIEK